MDNLTFHCSNLKTNRPNNSLSDGWNQVASGFEAVLGIHKRLRASIVEDIKRLNVSKDNQKEELRKCRDVVLRVRDNYNKIRNEVPRYQSVYLKRCKEFEALDREKDPVGSPRFIKLQNDVLNADIDYKKAVWELERVRKHYAEVWETQQQRFRDIERERIISTQKVLLDYLDFERSGALEASRIWEAIANGIKADVNPINDSILLSNEIGHMWPNHPTQLYRNYYTGDMKDLIFNVPLRDYLHHHRAAVPILVEKLVKSIEARALDREGIYRISGKSSDIHELKIRVEKDLSSVNFDDYDPNVLASVVKQYLRQLPEPLFHFPANDRADFAKLPVDERKRILKNIMHNEMQISHRTTLKFLIEHFIKIAANAEVNKMTAQNIALCFAPVIFGNQTESLPFDPYVAQPQHNQGGGLFRIGGQSQGNGTGGRHNSEPTPSDIAQFQSWKGDAVIETLMDFKDEIFPPDGTRPPPPPLTGQASNNSIQQTQPQPVKYESSFQPPSISDQPVQLQPAIPIIMHDQLTPANNVSPIDSSPQTIISQSPEAHSVVFVPTNSPKSYLPSETSIVPPLNLAPGISLIPVNPPPDSIAGSGLPIKKPSLPLNIPANTAINVSNSLAPSQPSIPNVIPASPISYPQRETSLPENQPGSGTSPIPIHHVGSPSGQVPPNFVQISPTQVATVRPYVPPQQQLTPQPVASSQLRVTPQRIPRSTSLVSDDDSKDK